MSRVDHDSSGHMSADMFNEIQGMLRICIQLNDDDVELGLEYPWQIVKLGIRGELAYRACTETHYSLRDSLAALLLRANQGDRQNVGTERVVIMGQGPHQGIGSPFPSLMTRRFDRRSHIAPKIVMHISCPSPREEGDEGSDSD